MEKKMENFFVGYRENGILYGCKDDISSINKELETEEKISRLYRHNSKNELKEKFKSILWEPTNVYMRGNNGFPFIIYLLKDSVKSYAQYHRNLMALFSDKTKKELPLYNETYFQEKNETMHVCFTNYGETFHSYNFKWVYVFDLDEDVLFVENNEDQTKEEITRNGRIYKK